MSKNSQKQSWGKIAYCLLLTAFCLSAVGCRYDMQDQPRYRAQKKSEFFNDNKAMRDLPEGTVARGLLREDKAFYQGKKTGATGGQTQNAAGGGAQQATTDASGNTVVTSFPDAVDEFPVPVTKELLDRGGERYKIFCQACHGPLGYGDGMIVRRGFSKPPVFHDDRLRNAPVGHFYDVITNGWGKMNAYNHMVPVADRWAIVAYIRALQISQNPSGVKPLPTTATQTTNNANTAVGTTSTTGNANIPQVPANTAAKPTPGLTTSRQGNTAPQGGIR
jgi:mono/diheme cytochrome c family protein